MKSLLHLVAQFTDEAAAAESIADLNRQIDAVGRELGFRYWALVHHVSLRRHSPRLIESSNYPALWQDEFVGRQLFIDDPVLHASQRTLTAFAWENMDRLLPMRRRHHKILRKSRREGLGEGITIPAHVPGEPNGSCSFATAAGKPLPCGNRLFCAQLIGLHAFERARQLLGYPGLRELVPHLSPREEDCIRLLAGGASDKAIARSLHLSPETVHRYIKTARAAYGAATRTELIVRALADGLVTFAEAIPQSG